MAQALPTIATIATIGASTTSAVKDISQMSKVEFPETPLMGGNEQGFYSLSNPYYTATQAGKIRSGSSGFMPLLSENLVQYKTSTGQTRGK